MFSMSRSTKNFPQLKMCDNCVKSYSSWNAFFCWLAAFGYSNRKQLYYKMWSKKKLNFENHWHMFFFTAILITYIKGGTPPNFFCRRGLQWRRLHLIFFTEVIKFYWLMLLLYPGELYRLLGASSIDNYSLLSI